MKRPSVAFDAPVGRRRSGRLAKLVTFVIGCMVGAAIVVVYIWRAGSVEDAPALALPEDPPVSMILGEPFLTAIIRKALNDLEQPAPITNIFVRAEQHEIVVKGNVEVLGRPTMAMATLRPELRDGGLGIDVVNTEFGDLPVPMEQAVEEQINARIRALLTDLPVTITGVRVVRERGLIVTFRVDLDRI